MLVLKFIWEYVLGHHLFPSFSCPLPSFVKFLVGLLLPQDPGHDVIVEFVHTPNVLVIEDIGFELQLVGVAERLRRYKLWAKLKALIFIGWVHWSSLAQWKSSDLLPDGYPGRSRKSPQRWPPSSRSWVKVLPL